MNQSIETQSVKKGFQFYQLYDLEKLIFHSLVNQLSAYDQLTNALNSIESSPEYLARKMRIALKFL